MHSDLVTGHTEHTHITFICLYDVHSLCRDLLMQRVEVGFVGVVQFLWHVYVISERVQPPLVGDSNVFVTTVELHVHVCRYSAP